MRSPCRPSAGRGLAPLAVSGSRAEQKREDRPSEPSNYYRRGSHAECRKKAMQRCTRKRCRIQREHEANSEVPTTARRLHPAARAGND